MKSFKSGPENVSLFEKREEEIERVKRIEECPVKGSEELTF